MYVMESWGPHTRLRSPLWAYVLKASCSPSEARGKIYICNCFSQLLIWGLERLQWISKSLYFWDPSLGIELLGTIDPNYSIKPMVSKDSHLWQKTKIINTFNTVLKATFSSFFQDKSVEDSLLKKIPHWDPSKFFYTSCNSFLDLEGHGVSWIRSM